MVAAVKTVASPNSSYDSLVQLWRRSRALCRGERFVKSYDVFPNIDTNLLIPFSPSMTPQQYNFFKSEAELPGIVANFSKTLIGGLLRKQPIVKFNVDVPEDVTKWIVHEFGKDDSPLQSFLDEALWEEVQTSRCWIFVDYPRTNEDMLIDKTKIKPYPIIYQAESIINWRTRNINGKTILDRVVVKGYTEAYDDGEYEFHPKSVETVWVHELNESGNYQVRVYKCKSDTEPSYLNGDKQVNGNTADIFVLDETVEIKVNGNPIQMIPAWPLNGSIEPGEPLLTGIVDKEVALYNKISRRNHLLYGAATYTPIIMSDMSKESFEEIVAAGLGSWILLEKDGKADVLKTPTEALTDMDRSISSGFEEIARLGVRMLSPETAQSGVALELRNAAQTAQLGSLNIKVSNILRQIIAFMVSWQLDTEIAAGDVEFSLSEDFNPLPIGVDWLRLATEWYQNGLIPRKDWLNLLKQNDMLPPDYDDERGQQEITEDELVVPPSEQFNRNLEQQMKKA